MPPFKSLLEEALEAWSDTRQGIIDEVENIPADQFDFRPTPEVRSVAGLIQHILEISLMMTGELTRADTDFHRVPWSDLLGPYADRASEAQTKDALVDLLRSSMEEAEEKFREAGELEMFQLIKRFDDEQGTKLAWLHHGIAQEMYHRGQLALYERLLGIEPALTRRIRTSS